MLGKTGKDRRVLGDALHVFTFEKNGCPTLVWTRSRRKPAAPVTLIAVEQKTKGIEKMKKLMTSFITFLAFTLSGCGSNGGNHLAVASAKYTPIFINYTSTAVKTAAETGLPGFIGSLKAGPWSSFGFLNLDELDSARLGAPYPVFGMMNTGKTDQTIFPTGEWEFPVMVSNDYRCLLKVAQMNGAFQTVGIGAAGLATWLQAAERTHPSIDFSAKGLVKIYDHDTTIVMLNPFKEQPSFLLLPPVTDMVKSLSQYSTWVSTDPVPVLSFDELYLIYARLGI
jgi:hypothetical protein